MRACFVAVSLEELALGIDSVVFQNRVVLVRIQSTGMCDVSWYRSIESIESVTLHLCHDKVECKAKTACSERPQ
jgi:hypothetical protein